MICSKCGKPTDGGRFCTHCGSTVDTAPSRSGLATLRVKCRKHLPIWMMVIQPVNYFMSYKVYISVGDQEYVLKSKKEQIDISVVPGVHNVRISSTSKKQAKVMKGVGIATQFIGAVVGSGSTYVVGSVLDDVSGALSNDGVNVEFEPGEFMEVKVKPNFMGRIVEDNGK